MLRVIRYVVRGTGRACFEAWETGARYFGEHSFLHHDDRGELCGAPWSRALPAEIEAMPAGPERSAAVAAWRAAREAECVAAILRAFPEAATGAVRGYRIEVEPVPGELPTEWRDVPDAPPAAGPWVRDDWRDGPFDPTGGV